MKRLYRESMGRWRRTHSGHDGQVWSRDDIHWWNTTRREEFDNLECRIGETVGITVPEDVSWSPVIVCTADNRLCVRIPVST